VTRRAVSLSLAATLLAAALPAATSGAAGAKPKKPAILRVCKAGKPSGKPCYARIQAAVAKAKAGDSVRVGHGVWRESVRIAGKAKRGIKLIGDPESPGKVVLDGRGLSGPAGLDAVTVDGADDVRIDGFRARGYRRNGFLVKGVEGYTLTHLEARSDGAHGISVVGSQGGTIRDSDASFHGEAGFHVAGTPPSRSARPVRTLITNVRAWGNAVGFLGANMSDARLQNSEFFNNGLGIVVHSTPAARHAPPRNVELVGNEVFWNNFNFYAAAPFKPARPAGFSYPVGAGIVLLGAREHTLDGNRIYGHYLIGLAVARAPRASGGGQPEDVEALNNELGLGGADRNGRDILYDGSGAGNCFQENETRSPTVPASSAVFTPCDIPKQPNAPDAEAAAAIAEWTAPEPPGEASWITGPHQSQPGREPLERCTVSGPVCAGQPG